MTRLTSLLIAAVALLSLAGTANATIVLTPGTSIPGLAGMGPSNCEPGCVETIFGTSGLSLLYKSDEDGLVGDDSGPYAGSYTTFFSNSIGDPSNALILWNLFSPDIDCPSCYLAIKDGNQTPAYYFYDLSAWNGTETISLQNFWPGNGAISHIAIWGRSGSTSVPEPSTLALFGLSLLGIGLARRLKRK